MFKRSLKGWLSLIGMFVGIALIIMAILLSLRTMSTLFWPLLVVGIVTGFTCTPVYYYFKTRDVQSKNPLENQVNILSSAGESAKNRRQVAENGDGQRLKPIYPLDEPKSSKNN
jgi:hypothetical protein